jgi:hypothetical protein
MNKTTAPTDREGASGILEIVILSDSWFYLADE